MSLAHIALCCLLGRQKQVRRRYFALQDALRMDRSLPKSLQEPVTTIAADLSRNYNSITVSSTI